MVQRLKATGWSFASHGWGHLDAANISLATLIRDTQRWKQQVEPLIGSTPIYVFPHGSSVSFGDAKFQTLLDQGFRVFYSVGPKPYVQATASCVVIDRRHIDGMALLTQRSLHLDLFDAADIVDPNRPI